MSVRFREGKRIGTWDLRTLTVKLNPESPSSPSIWSLAWPGLAWLGFFFTGVFFFAFSPVFLCWAIRFFAWVENQENPKKF